MTKYIGFGNTLGVDSSGGSTYVIIAEVVDAINRSGMEAEVIDTAVLADQYGTFCKGMIDPGTLEFDIAYDPGVGTSAVLAGLLESCTPAGWEVTYTACCSGEVAESFVGLLTSFSITSAKADLVTASISVKVSGNPGLS